MVQLLPNQIYQVFKSRPLTEDGKNSLIYLYQPIIGSEALSLYFTLEGDLKDTLETEFVHLDILNALDFGMQHFGEARRKLEGIGLLKVYTKEIQEFGMTFLYHLQEPVHPEAFFEDELYSFLLLSRVGERKFQQLVTRFRPRKINVSDYQETTASFMDVYRFNTDSFAKKQEQLNQVSVDFKPSTTKFLLPENQLDWDFLSHEAQRHYISPKNFDEAFKKQLVLYHLLYGYDELTLVQSMLETVSLSDGMVDQKKLEKAMLKKNQLHFKKTKDTSDYSSDIEVRRFNTLKQSGYSDNDLLLIRESEKFAPIEFLQGIKAEKNSFVTDSEQWLIKSLVERSPLTNSVINVLIHYVLVVQNNVSLSSNYVNNIAAEWAQLQIKSAEDAIKHVRELVKNAKEKRKALPKTRNKVVRQEQLPSWAEKPAEEKILAPERQAEIDKKLQDYLQKKAGDK